MEFDYYALYKDWSTLDLVRVARTPNDYAPDAVIVAKDILNERRVSMEEMDAAEWELAQAEMAAAIGKPRITDYLERFTEPFLPDRGKASETGPGWFTFLLVCYGIYFVFSVYSITKHFVYLQRCVNCLPDKTGLALNLCLAGYNTVCFYFLLKQKSVAWTMVLIQAIVFTCSKFSLLFSFYEHNISLPNLLTGYVLPIPFYVVFGYFLWRPYVVTFFHITRPVKDRALLIGISAGIVAMAIV